MSHSTDRDGDDPRSDGDGDPPDARELESAADLREALETERDPTPGTAAATVAALRAGRAGAPPLAAATRARLVERAIAAARASRRRRLVRNLGVGLAVAAAALLSVGGLGAGARFYGAPAANVAYGGASDSVFAEPFADDQRPSERLDRLTTARAHDYFAALAEGGAQ